MCLRLLQATALQVQPFQKKDMEESSFHQLEKQSKPVQELIINDDVLPEKYIHKGGTIDTSLPLVEIPVIDFCLLSQPQSPTREAEFKKLQSALSLYGCFQAINHGMTSSFLDDVRKLTKQFFANPMEEKKKLSRPVDDIEGYGNDMILSENQVLDWTDRLYLKVYPEDQRKLKFWPEKPANFREILHEFTMKSHQISEVLLKALAESLNLEKHCFLDQYGERAQMFARFNFYPRCPRPDLILGLKPHADGSAVTILLQDKEVEGLQVLKDDKWVRVPTIPEALFINIGDQVEIMSNGMFKSPVHRVVTNTEKERISVAVFCVPELDKEIGPVNGLLSENRPRLYKTMKNYVNIYFQNYQQGKRPIDAAKV